jgi:hypothetical protein
MLQLRRTLCTLTQEMTFETYRKHEANSLSIIWHAKVNCSVLNSPMAAMTMEADAPADDIGHNG